MTDWIRPGQRVVQHRPWRDGDRGVFLKFGVTPTHLNCVYVIRDVVARSCDCPITFGLRFEEVRNDPITCTRCGDSDEPSFNAEFYRPVRETSIEDLRRLQSPTPARARETERELT